MSALLQSFESAAPAGALRDAAVPTAELWSELLSRSSGRATSGPRAARLAHLIRSEAWVDAALGLVELELPQWRLRRLAYDEGEWHCALSRQRELPDWLDQSVEGHHANLALAILGAIAEALSATPPPASRTSVPAVRGTDAIYEPILTDDFA